MARGRDQLRGTRGPGGAAGLTAELPGGVPGGDGCACPATRGQGDNDPKHWDPQFGTGEIHIGVSVFSDSEETWRRTIAFAREQYEGISGFMVLFVEDFGAQPGDLNPLGYKDSIDQPAIEGSGVEPLPGQGPPIKAGEFILGYPGEAGVPLPMPQPDVLGRNGTFVGTAQVSVARGRVQSLPPGAWKHRGGAGTARREAGRPLAQRRPADARAGGRRPGARRRPAAEQRLRLRERPERPEGAARMPHAAHEPAGHEARSSDRREYPPHHPAQHDLRSALRSERAVRGRTTRSRAALYFIFISAKAMATMEFLQQEWINNGNFIGPRRRARPEHRAAGGKGDIHHPEGPGQAPHPRHRDVQRAARRRVLLHAELVGIEWIGNLAETDSSEQKER